MRQRSHQPRGQHIVGYAHDWDRASNVLRCPNCEIAAANENVDTRVDEQRRPFLVLLRATVKAPGIDGKIPTFDEAFPSQPVE